MTKLEQAARQLLEVAEGIQHGTDWNNGTHAKIYRPKFPAAITALREALAEQAEQDQADATSEPFLEVFCDPSYFDMWCVRDVHDKDFNHTIHVNSKETANHAKALIESWVRTYASPVRTKDPCNPLQDLTDDEIYEVCKDVPFVVIGPDYDLAIARAVIAKDREKNK